ncbi:extensin family protein [Erythrobacter sp. F6033]|uniref:extensin-like domain-containing protein n=1 Tax=Erythrobacter sp. F6033 TaxID=2926401 RepID=UPI001FF3CF8F|nr:extensin family protein [Erythrobacter sp. F6033]MCK0127805.1 extensin family protein [Erythrobacter sp. F6033]
MKTHLIFRKSMALAGAVALGGCSSLIPSASAPSSATPDYAAARAKLGTQTPTRTSTPAPAPRRFASTPQSIAPNAADASCLAELNQAGAQFNPIPDTYAAPGCNKLGTVQLSALSGDANRFGVSNIGPVKCRTAKAFNAWARFGVDRAARQILGSPLERIETMGSYSCRNVAGSNRKSAHATAGAIDVSGFMLADGRRISLKGDWDSGTPAEREFLRVVHKSACKRFGTVLGPEYNRAHADHFHLEGTGAKFCR